MTYAVNVGGLDDGVAGDAERVPAEIVDEDEDDIGTGLGLGESGQREVEDIGEEAANHHEVSIVAQGDPDLPDRARPGPEIDLGPEFWVSFRPGFDLWPWGQKPDCNP